MPRNTRRKIQRKNRIQRRKDTTRAECQTKMSDGALRAYLEDLQEFSFDQVRYAIREHRRISKWFPSIAELRDLAVRYIYSDSPRDNAARRGADWNDLT